MPEISRFFGIIVRMYSEPTEAHHMPHFHVYYQEFSAIYSIDPVAMLAGYLPQRQQRLVEAWAELHQEELNGDCQSLLHGMQATPIKPLE